MVKLGGCVIEIPEGAMKENMFFSFMLIYIDEAYEEVGNDDIRQLYGLDTFVHDENEFDLFLAFF